MTASEFLADLRLEHLRLRFALVRVEIIGLALSKGVLDIETALDLYATSSKLHGEPDPFTAEFMSEVMRDEPRRKYRRAA